MQKMYLLCVVYCVYTMAVTCIGILQLFTVFTVCIPHEQTAFPPKLMESNASLFGKLIPRYSVVSEHKQEGDNYSCSVCTLAFVWEVRKGFSLNKPV